jgi:hypothetical protein
MPDAPRLPADALYIPEALKRGDNVIERTASVARVADELLGVDLAAGERSYIRLPLPGEQRMFVTKSLADSINFPRDHKRSGRARYRWVPYRDGIELGYLKEGV